MGFWNDDSGDWNAELKWIYLMESLINVLLLKLDYSLLTMLSLSEFSWND